MLQNLSRLDRPMVNSLPRWWSHFIWIADDWRVRTHLERIEARLRRVDTKTWPEPLRAARLKNLDRLHAYWQRGQFPRNHDVAGLWMPCFIDSDQRTCAVAQLVIDSGQVAFAQTIAVSANHAKIKAMYFPELNAWV